MKLTDHILLLADGTRSAAEIARTVETTERYVRQYLSRQKRTHLIKEKPAPTRLHMPNPWANKTLIERLKVHVHEGLSSGVIAQRLSAEFQIPMTRNQVIGKISRLGLWNQARTLGSTATRVKRGLALAPDAPVRSSSTKTGTRVKPLDVEPEPFLIRTDIPVPIARKTLVELERGDCKFPVGDPRTPDFGFCAQPRVPGKTYCIDCCQRAYKPIAVKTHEKETVDA